MPSAHDRVLYALCENYHVRFLGVHSTMESALEELEGEFEDDSTLLFALTGTTSDTNFVPRLKRDFWWSLAWTKEQIYAWGGAEQAEEVAFDPIIAREEVSDALDKYRRLCGEGFDERGWDLVQETVTFVVSSEASVVGSPFEDAFARGRRAIPGDNKIGVPTRHQVIKNIVMAAVHRELARRREAE